MLLASAAERDGVSSTPPPAQNTKPTGVSPLAYCSSKFSLKIKYLGRRRINDRKKKDSFVTKVKKDKPACTAAYVAELDTGASRRSPEQATECEQEQQTCGGKRHLRRSETAVDESAGEI